MNDRERLLTDIDVLNELEDNWDGCSARKPFTNALRDIRIVVHMFTDEELGYCSVFPSCDGGVYLQYRRDKVRIAVWVDGYRVSGVLRNGYTGEKFYIDSMGQLSEKINMLSEIHQETDYQIATI